MRPVIAYHFTTETAAAHIRSRGFTPSEDLFGRPVVWLTRNPDDAAAQRRGPVRLTVTVMVNSDDWLIVSPGMFRSLRRRSWPKARTLAWTSLGMREDEALDAFVRRKTYAGIWYASDARPWLAVLDPSVISRSLTTGSLDSQTSP